MTRASGGTALAALFALSEALTPEQDQPSPSDEGTPPSDEGTRVVRAALRAAVAQAQPDGDGPSDADLRRMHRLLFEIEQAARVLRGHVSAVFYEPTPVALRYFDYQGTDVDDRQCPSQWEAEQTIAEWLDPALHDDWRYEGVGKVHGGQIHWSTDT